MILPSRHSILNRAVRLSFVLGFAATNAIARNSFQDASQLPTQPGLPDPLLMSNGEHVTDKKQWIKKRDRKSTRLNSSHSSISYAVFCLKKKKKKKKKK